MNQANRTATLDAVSVALVRAAVGALYFTAIALLLRDYAAVDWGIYRIHYDMIDILDILVAAVFVSIASTVVPRRIKSPSSLLLIICYLFIVMPAGVCLLALESSSGASRYTTLFVLLFAFSGSAFAVRNSFNDHFDEIARMPSRLFGPILLIGAVALLFFLYYRFGSIMSFATLDNLYEQRARGAATNFVDGYAQTYSQYVFSTGLLAFGLYRKNVLFIAVGLLGSLVNFAITAEKAGLIYPVFVIFLYFALKAKAEYFVSSASISIFLALILMLSTYTRNVSSISEFLCWYLGTRTILTPGIFIVHYADFFFERGYTFFAHIRGLDVFIPIPGQYISDPRWPQLGIIVGEDLIGMSRLNANANFIASDGIASLGLIGVFVSFGIFTVIIKVFDILGRGVPQTLLLPLLLSIGLTLTNGSALSVLTSTGGLFWMLMLQFLFVKDEMITKDNGS